ncbi:DUF6003 family protein [Kitasatospora purpeofusca]|uniref:DUF6003 family protein n=1 Tax=Kitasatospora purpeofusca TaxID=67352 RepID=UPI0036C38DA0
MESDPEAELVRAVGRPVVVTGCPTCRTLGQTAICACRHLTVAATPGTSQDSTVPAAQSEPASPEEELRVYRQMVERRDELVRRAAGSGLSEAEIARLTGHSRTTVRSILGRDRH